MSDAGVVLASLEARLRALGANGRADVARVAAPLVQAELRATAGAGTDPYGVAWRLRQDGTRAIPEAAAAVDVVARGPVILMRVHRGAAIQNTLAATIGRRLLPDAQLPMPPRIVGAVQEAFGRVFRGTIGG